MLFLNKVFHYISFVLINENYSIMILLLIYLFIAVFISFLCSIMEAVLLSLPVSFLKAESENGKKSAKTFLSFKNDIDKPLSAILSLNTVAHTVGAAGVGAQASIVFGDEYFGLISAVLTFLILIFSEIIPKTIGANYSKQLMGFSAGIIKSMIIITYPLVLLSAFFSKVFSAKDKKSFSISREEISALANIGQIEGIIGKNENRILQNLIKLRNVTVGEIMTPRVVVVVANEELNLKEFLKNEIFLHFSRIPVYNNTKDNITGFVFRDTVFEKLADDRFELKLKDIKRDIIKFSDDTNVFKAWDILLEQKVHIALITSEFGGMEGIVTLEDIIESLLGFEIMDERDKIKNMQQYAKERWKQKQKKYDLLK